MKQSEIILKECSINQQRSRVSLNQMNFKSSDDCTERLHKTLNNDFFKYFGFEKYLNETQGVIRRPF